MSRRIILWAIVLSMLTGLAVAQSSSLFGSVRWQTGGAAVGVTVSIGGYNVVTDKTGSYRFGFLRPGTYIVVISPPGKPSRSFKVAVAGNALRRDFTINW